MPISKRRENQRIRLYERYKGICGICLKPVSFEEFTRDHIIPKSKGGSDSFKNLQLAHYKCNQAKADSMKSNILIFPEWVDPWA